MNYLVASDIHGNMEFANFLIDRIKQFSPEKIILLGDIYDGNKSKVIDGLFEKLNIPIECVEGNCDYRYKGISKLNFVGSNILEEKKDRKFFFTHGHIYNRYNVPAILGKGDVLFYGHTHVNSIIEEKGIHFVNVGSVGRPREQSKNSFVIINEKNIEIRDVEFGELINKLELK
jgi:putative phosphoesterase